MASLSSMENSLERERRIGMHFSLLHSYLKSPNNINTINNNNNNHNNNNINIINSEGAEWERVGVSLKTLYSDFVVREMSPLYSDGAPLTLESLPIPPVKDNNNNNNNGKSLKRKREELNDETVVNTSEEDIKFEVRDEKEEELLKNVQIKFGVFLDTDDLTLLVESLRRDEKKITFKSTLTKEKRTKVHELVKELLGSTHISRTETGALVIEKATSILRREEIRRSNPKRTQKFLHFTLYKENIDSNRAIRAVANFLGLQVRQLFFSGTKDKRAVTLQRVAVRGLSSEKLSEINNRSFGPESKVKVCSFKETDIGLRLGDTLGNHFQIVLRLLQGSSEISNEMIKTIKYIISNIGVINYFGPQRFGTTEVLTSDVGIHLLAGRFKKALEFIFESKSIVEPNLLPVKEAVEKGCFEEALKLLPRYCFQERDILNHLVRFPNDFNGAFHKIPRTLGMLYCHAVQSLIWNFIASERLKLSKEPLIGDLVLKSRYTQILKNKDDQLIKEENNNNNIYMDDIKFQKDDGLPEVVKLTAEDIESGLFNLTDILLTVPGPDTQLHYPDISVCNREAYYAELSVRGAEALMSSDNSLVKVFHFHGTYRPLIIRPKNFEMRMVSTTGPRVPIIPTDLEVLTGAVSASEGNDEINNNNNNNNNNCKSTSLFKAIVVEFSLPPGSYATSVLREFSVCCSEGYHATVSSCSDCDDFINGDSDVITQ